MLVQIICVLQHVTQLLIQICRVDTNLSTHHTSAATYDPYPTLNQFVNALTCFDTREEEEKVS